MNKRSPEADERPISRRSGSHLALCGMTYKVANRRLEREAAFRLTHEAYTRSGLMKPNRYGMRVTPFHLLPTTTVFNALHMGGVIHTMSLVCNSEHGLPAQGLYAWQIAELQQQGLRLGEVTCLASLYEYFSHARMFHVFVRLVGLMFQFARRHEIQQLVIVVHPRQQSFYERSLGFEQIGGRQACPWVCNQPAVAMTHDFEFCDQHRYRLYDQVYAYRHSSWELQPRPMPPEDRRFFALAAELHADHSRLKESA